MALSRAVARHRRLLSAGLAAASVAVGLGVLAPDPPGGVPVVVAARDLAGGTVLGTDDLDITELPTAVAPDGTAATTETLVGRTLAGAARRGEPVTDARLVGPGLLGTSEVAAGLVAAPVRLADAAVAALVSVGDVVDVLATSAAGPTGADPEVARVVAPGARVLAVPAPTGDGLGALTGDGALLVLAVPTDTAADLAAAASRGPLSITMR